jgi:cell division protein FtsW
MVSGVHVGNIWSLASNNLKDFHFSTLLFVLRIHLKKNTHTVDKRLLFLTIVLTVIGLIAVADASAPIAVSDFADKYYFVKQQLIWATAGFFLLFVFANIKYKFWEKFATAAFIASIILLLMVLIPGLGTYAFGAKRWLRVGSISFQPSEFVKFTLSVYIARIVSEGKKTIAYFTPIILVAILVMLQPDLGTTLVIVTIGMAEIFISGANLLPYFAAIISSFFLSLVLIMTSKYRKARLLTFIKQTQDPLGIGYHMRQVLIGLGVGGFFGVGLGQSRQKYLFLPQTATDSIFAIIAEETGFLGASLLIIIYLAFIFRILKIARNSQDSFSKIISVGFAAWIGGQTFLNIGSMVAVIPLTGITLPFVSYGGSSLVAVLAAVGVLLNISKYEKSGKG